MHCVLFRILIKHYSLISGNYKPQIHCVCLNNRLQRTAILYCIAMYAKIVLAFIAIFFALFAMLITTIFYSSSKGLRSFLLKGLNHESGINLHAPSVVSTVNRIAPINSNLSTLGNKKNQISKPIIKASIKRPGVIIVLSFFILLI